MKKNFFTENFIVHDSEIEFVIDEIIDINLKMNIFAIGLGLISFVCVGVYSIFNNVISTRTTAYFLSAIILFILLYANYIPFKNKYKKTVILTFISSCIIAAIGLWMAYITPDRRSVAFYIIILLESLIFINKPRYNTLYVLCVDFFFLFTMRTVKINGIFEFDVLSMFLYSFIGIVLEHLFVKSRLTSLINAKKIMLMSHQDTMTGVKNRNSYENAISRIEATNEFVGTIIIFDIDGLHNINNTKGHILGDAIIIKVAKILSKQFENVYRTGGDEFIVISNNPHFENLQEIINTIMFDISDLNIKLSIGHSSSNGEKCFDEAINEAESLMYNTKANNYINKYSKEIIRAKERVLDDLSFDDIGRAYTLLHEVTRDYIYIYDLDTDIIQISEAAVRKYNMDTSKLAFTKRLKDLVYHEDYELIKQYFNDIVIGKNVEHNLRYRWLDRKGDPHWIVWDGKVVESSDKKVRFLIGSMAEIDNTPLADNLTGFLNLETQREYLNRTIKKDKFYFLLLGLDNLRTFNKHYGYETGDKIIKFISNIIKDKLRPNQEVIKLYSDQFLIIDDNTDSIVEAVRLYNEIRDEIIKQDFFDGQDFITISAGLLNSDHRFDTFNEYMKRVSCTFSEAKRKGKDRINIFNKNIYASRFAQENLLVLLKKSIINNFEGFSLLFQPILKEPNGEIKGVEALLRFESNGVKYSPIEFIPILEENDLIIEVGKFIVEKSIALLKLTKNNFTVSINSSYKQIMNEESINEFIEKVTKEGVKENIIVELTESGYITKQSSSLKLINKLVDNGIKISIDDFGTGYSNFYNIIEWQPAFIKIDKQFITDCDKDEQKKTILTKMIEIGHQMKSEIVCEGVETYEELDAVKTAKTDYVQGYYYSKPLSIEELFNQYDINNK